MMAFHEKNFKLIESQSIHHDPVFSTANIMTLSSSERRQIMLARGRALRSDPFKIHDETREETPETSDQEISR